eukprot:8769098-Ditylum_brightwellii.AAC.1
MAQAENPVNNNITHQIKNDDIVGDAGTFVLISDEGMNKIKNKKLQDELGKWGFIKRGRKSELIAHLKKAVHDKVLIVNDNAASTTNIASSSTELPWFPDGTY